MPILVSEPLLQPWTLRKPRPQDTVEERRRKIDADRSTYTTRYMDSSSNTPTAAKYSCRTRTNFGVPPGLAEEKYFIKRKKSYADRRSWAGFPGDNVFNGKSCRVWTEQGVKEWVTSAMLRRGLIETGNQKTEEENSPADSDSKNPDSIEKELEKQLQKQKSALYDLSNFQPVPGQTLENWKLHDFEQNIPGGGETLPREIAESLFNELKCKEIEYQANAAFDDSIVRGVNFTLKAFPKFKIREKFPLPENKQKVPGPGHYRQPTTLGIGKSGKGHPLWKQDGRPVFGIDVRFPTFDSAGPGPGKYPAIALAKDPTLEWTPKWSLGVKNSYGGAF
ncbi:unnamed protein product [Amoebophrya sp. A120]|nr:unnamed protein product [Amoebophrya sp. A120]|eukprot:GSA120T00013852001.1